MNDKFFTYSMIFINSFDMVLKKKKSIGKLLMVVKKGIYKEEKKELKDLEDRFIDEV